MDLTPYTPSHLTNLNTYEDFLSYYIQVDEIQSGFSWIKADLIAEMVKKLGSTSLEQLSRDLKKPRSTISNYTRVSMAFPPEKRNPALSFSAHFQASYADSFDEKTKQFKSAKRFEWLDKAADENLSTRQLQAQIQSEKINEVSSEKEQEIEKMSRSIRKKNEELRLKSIKGDEDSFSHLKMIYTFIYGQKKN